MTHFLEDEWAFWVDYWNEGQYHIDKIASFASVEEFWGVFPQIPEIKKHSNGRLSIFKNGYKPAWEDPIYAKGGMLRVQTKAMTQSEWENIVFKLIGGELEQKIGAKIIFGLRLKDNDLDFWISELRNIGEKLIPELGLNTSSLSSKVIENNKNNKHYLFPQHFPN